MNLLYGMWGWAQKHFINHAALLPRWQTPVHSSPWYHCAVGKGTKVVPRSQAFLICILPSPPGRDGPPSPSSSLLSLFNFPSPPSDPVVRPHPTTPPTAYKEREMKLIYTEDLIKANICILSGIVEKWVSLFPGTG